jgi:hypothetical protein
MNPPSPGLRNILIVAAIVAAGATLCIIAAHSASVANGGGGFPLDDAWIHLQFARNLHDYGSFSYFRDQMATSGSTSPLFTFLLSLTFFFSSDGILGSQILGIASLCLAAFLTFRVALHEFDGRLLFASGAACLLVLEPRMQWAALSGMETTLFIALMLLTVLMYRERKPVALGIAAGLALWTRPEALLLMAVLTMDVLYQRVVRVPGKRKGKRNHGPAEGERAPIPMNFQRLFLMLLPLVAAYFAFNLILSGTMLPNTFSAKLTYYSGGGEGFPAAAFYFMTNGHMVVIAVLAVIGGVAAIGALIRRRSSQFLIYVLWPAGMFFAYWWKLPFLYQEGRYLMPVLPLVVILALGGLDTLLNLGAHRIAALRVRQNRMLAASVVMVLVAAQAIFATLTTHKAYAASCNYIGSRQVATAKWMSEHLPPDAVIGTHDIGAVAYYSGRRVADMVGLVSPQMIGNIGSFDGLNRFLAREHVSHLAVLRNWFEIDNQRLVYQTDERTPEIMEVWEYHPGTVHFVPQDVTRLVDVAESFLQKHQVDQAGAVIGRALQLDPQSSRAHLLAGRVHLARNRLDAAVQETRQALELRPANRDARLQLAAIAQLEGRMDEAKNLLSSLVGEYPDYAPAVERLEKMKTDGVQTTRSGEK